MMGGLARFILVAALMAAPGGGLGEGEAVLHGFSMGEDTVTITVSDCSCTLPEHFRFEINRAGGDLRMIRVLRRQPDLCLVPAIQSSFEYSFEEIGLEPGAHVVLKTPMKAFDRLSNDDCYPVR